MRTAVYSGTRNVYGDIETALKSLLYHTQVDKVYILAEDDEPLVQKYRAMSLEDVCRNT